MVCYVWHCGSTNHPSSAVSNITQCISILLASFTYMVMWYMRKDVFSQLATPNMGSFICVISHVSEWNGGSKVI